jgi:hypothetical protein
VGITTLNLSSDSSSVSFEAAKRQLKYSESLSLNQFEKETRVLFIKGGNLDGSGNAEQWVFGINKGDINELRIYGSTGWTIIAWNYPISADQIDLDHVISPTTIFDDNKDQILGNSSPTISVQRNIELRNGTYTITINSGSTSQILRYNATTGAAIE